MYPPVGPAKTAKPPLNKEKTGKPMAPSITYRKTEAKEVFKGKTEAIIKMTNSESVKGTGGVGILICAKMQSNAV